MAIVSVGTSKKKDTIKDTMSQIALSAGNAANSAITNALNNAQKNTAATTSNAVSTAAQSAASKLPTTSRTNTASAANTAKTQTTQEIAQGLLDSINAGTLKDNPNASKWNGYGWNGDVFWYDDGTGVTNINKDTGELLAKYDKNGTYVDGKSMYDNRNVSAAEEYLNNALSNTNLTAGINSSADAINAYKNKAAFSYDPSSDLLFQQNLNNYMNNGRMAMQDTMGQAAALTGGYGSSYATNAANQAYNSYVQGAYNNIDKYYDMALASYNNDDQRYMNIYNMLSEQELRDYQKERDAADDAYRDKVFNYGVERDKISDEQWNKTYDYNAERDKSDDAYRDKVFDYNVGQDAIANQLAKDKFDWDKQQDTISNAYRSSKGSSNSGGVSTNTSSNSSTATPEKSLYTATQLETAKKKAAEAYTSGGEEAYNAYLEEQNQLKAFTDGDLTDIDEYVRGNVDLVTLAMNLVSKYLPSGTDLYDRQTGKTVSTQDVLNDFLDTVNSSTVDDQTRANAYSTFESRIKRLFSSVVKPSNTSSGSSSF